MVTLKDIAEMTSYSIATVSRVLNSDPEFSVSDETKEKIIHAAKSLNYQKSENNLSKRIDNNYRIAVFIHDVGDNDLPNPFIKNIQRGINFEAYKENIEVDFYKISEIDKISVSKNVIGALTIGTICPTVIEKHTFVDIPLVYIGNSYDPKKYSSVKSDYWTSTIEMLENYLNRGIKNISLLVGNSTKINCNNEQVPLINDRFLAYRSFLSMHGLYSEDNVYTSDYTMEAGYNHIVQMIKQDKLPEAIISNNDIIALGILKALKEYSIHIPKDIEIFSYDNSEYSTISNVQLSSADTQPTFLGIKGVHMLLEQLHNQTMVYHTLIPADIAYRDSTPNNNL